MRFSSASDERAACVTTFSNWAEGACLPLLPIAQKASGPEANLPLEKVAKEHFGPRLLIEPLGGVNNAQVACVLSLTLSLPLSAFACLCLPLPASACLSLQLPVET